MKALLTALLLTLPLAAQADCGGGSTTNCWDSCTSSYIPVVGDSCETVWDSSRSCYTAVGNCRPGDGNGGGDSGCAHDSTSCWDSCTSSYLRFDNANSCTTAWNSGKGCYESLPYCSK